MHTSSLWLAECANQGIEKETKSPHLSPSLWNIPFSCIVARGVQGEWRMHSICTLQKHTEKVNQKILLVLKGF